MSSKKRNWKPQTALVHGGTLRSGFGETSEAMYLTQGYVYETAQAAEARFKGEEPGFIYSRYANPTVDMFEKRMCALEGAEDARATASGMAAVTAALLCSVKAGDHIVAARALFGSCRWVVETLAPKYGIEATLVDGTDIANWEKAVRPNTKLFFLESPTNPTLEVVDIAAVASLANSIGARLDRRQRLRHALAAEAAAARRPYRRLFGDQAYRRPGPLPRRHHPVGQEVDRREPARLFPPHRSEPVALQRLDAAEGPGDAAGARAPADGKRRPASPTSSPSSREIARVIYPGRADHPQADIVKKQMSGGSTLICLDVKGGKQAAFAFQNALDIVLISNNLGDAKSLITHPATTTHKNLSDEARAELGIGPGTLRLSVGLEDADDLLEDIEQALKAAG